VVEEQQDDGEDDETAADHLVLVDVAVAAAWKLHETAQPPVADGIRSSIQATAAHPRVDPSQRFRGTSWWKKPPSRWRKVDPEGW
jgi:hypothetical protein